MISDNSLTFLRFRFRERVYWITRARSTGSEKGREIQLIGEKFGFVSACDIDRKRWKNRSTKSVAKRVSNRPWNVCRKIDGKWGSEGERFPKRAPNRRILATPREPLNDISEIARGNIRPVDLASWVSQRATTSQYGLVGCVKLAPEVISPSRWSHRNGYYLLFPFLERNQTASSTMESRVNFLLIFLLTWTLIT